MIIKFWFLPNDVLVVDVVGVAVSPLLSFFLMELRIISNEVVGFVPFFFLGDDLFSLSVETIVL